MKRLGMSYGLNLLFALMILSSIACAQVWDLDLKIASGDRADTVTVTMGVDPRATDMYDNSIDTPLPPPPPSGSYAYFPLTDPEHPFYTGLAKDVRSTEDGEVTWTIRHEGDFSAENRVMFWNPEDLPFETEDLAWAHTMRIGAAYPGLEVEEWTDMSEAADFEFAAGKYVYVNVVMTTMVDFEAPEVVLNYPTDASAGVRFDAVMYFDIVDDVAGVDLSTLVLTINDEVIPAEDFISVEPMTFGSRAGYRISYKPAADWEEATDYIIEIMASDLADPAHEMPEVFTYWFSTGFEPPDMEPPHVADILPMPGDTLVPVYQTLSAKILDSGRGVDSTTITVTVNGEDYDGFTFELLSDEVSLFNYRITILPPGGEWMPNSPYDIVISACDRAEPANCTDTTLTFRTLRDVPPIWTLDLEAWTTPASGDTNTTDLTIGTDPDATNGYEAMYDRPQLDPDFMTFAYFPIESPFLSKLQTDIRHNDNTVTWEVKWNNPYPYTGLNWDHEVVGALEGDYVLGYGPSVEDMTWIDMSIYNTQTFESTDIVLIRFTGAEEDHEGPRIVNAYPAAGEVDIPVNPEITFDIIDPGTGVDGTSLLFYFNGSLVNAADYTIDVIYSGYTITYLPPALLDFDTNYEIRVIADDNNRPTPNSSDISWAFQTTSSCAPIFSTTLTLQDIGVEVTEVALTIMTDEEALVAKDDEDVPTFGFPSGANFYFPLDDEVFPKLATDARPNCAGNQYWVINTEAGSGTEVIRWDPLAIFDDVNWKLQIAMAGIAEMEAPESGWLDMTDLDSIAYTGAERPWIRLAYIGTINPTITGEAYTVGSDDAVIQISVLGTSTTVNTAPGGGTFEFSLSAGTYTIEFSTPDDDFVTVTMELPVGEDDINLEDIIYLYRNPVEVSGIVLLEGEPEYNVEVIIGAEGTTTETDGSFEFDIEPGTYTLCMRDFPTCYPDTCYEIVIDAPGPVDLGTFDYVIPPLTVSGTVTLDGEAGIGAEIYVDDPENVVATADDAGNYTFDIACDYYLIGARYPGYADEVVTQLVNEHTTLDFDLLPTDVSVSGTVTSACGSDVFGAVVTLGVEGGTVVVNSDGAFNFPAVPWGTYTLTVDGDCFVDYSTEIDVNRPTTVDVELTCIPSIEEVTVTAAELTRPLDAGEMFNNAIEWVAPVTELTVDYYEIIRDGLVIATVGADESIYFDDAVESGVEYEYQVQVYYTSTPSTCGPSPVVSGTPVVHPDLHKVLIIDFDNGATPIAGSSPAEKLIELLDAPAFGYTDGYTVTSQDPANLDAYDVDDYDVIIVTLGIDDADNAIMSGDMVDILEDYEGTIYVEGPDFGKDYSTVYEHFFGAFGIAWDNSTQNGNHEEDGNVATLDMQPAYFGFNTIVEYAHHSLADRSVDDFSLVGAQVMLRDQDDKIRFTARDFGGSRYLYASSVFIGAITYDLYDIKERLLGEVLWNAGLENTSVEELPTAPEEHSLATAYPNPFNPATTIEFNVATAGNVTVGIYDINGTLVNTLVSEKLDAGTYTTEWNGITTTSGIYFAKVETAGEVSTVKLILMK